MNKKQFSLKEERFVCQNPICKNMVYVHKYQGDRQKFRCPICLGLPFTTPGNKVLAGNYTSCTICDCQFKVMKDFVGKKPKCPPHRFEKCVSCNVQDQSVTFGPDPFKYEIHDDKTPVWMCKDCRYNAFMDT